LTKALAERIRGERARRAWSIADLALRSGVSGTMISKVERGEVNATALVLGKLSGAFALPLSTLLASAEAGRGRLTRRDGQTLWTDPDSGYTRRALSPDPAGPLQLSEIELPPGARVAYPAAAYAFLRQQLWMLSGTLRIDRGDLVHDLVSGDCLEFGPPSDCLFENPGAESCRYLVAVSRL